ncbi:MAG TPA: SpoIIE family protein phosphatase, partial [Flavobacteriales bacterium]|nr:SpoIIE family protein phosphatase [Flavobacteriales bacterium]
DGMDISLAVFHFPKNKDKIQVKWSGANNGLWHVRNKMLTEIKPDKQPVGKYAKANAFTTNTIDVQKGDTLYLFTDGYADQFGGPQGKKFKASAMKELIVSVQALNMKMQAKEIATVYHDWKAEMEQIDDVCMIGIKM